MLLNPNKETYNGEDFIGWKYSNPDYRSKVVGGTFSKRYPKEGVVMNEECDQHMLFWKGKARIIIDGIIHHVVPGDVFYIKPKQKYFMEQEGSEEVKLWLINYPEFDIKKHINIKD